MKSDCNSSECQEFRASEGGSETGSAHAESCAGCRSWQRQMSDIAQMSRSLPQFDVSEALTQRILSAVEQDTQAVTSRKQQALATLGLGACAALCLVVPFESIESLSSWALGLAGIVVLNLLVKNAQALEAGA